MVVGTTIRPKKCAPAGFRVCYHDRRGSGLNDLARGDAPSFGRLLDDLAEFLRSPLATAPIFLHAVSWGGKLAVALQRRRPQLVSGLVLLCPVFFARVSVPISRAAPHPLRPGSWRRHNYSPSRSTIQTCSRRCSAGAILSASIPWPFTRPPPDFSWRTFASIFTSGTPPNP